MKRFSSSKNPSNRRPKQTRKPLLETLEDRTLLDATAFLHHPEAVLRPDFHAGIAGKSSNTTPVMGPIYEPAGIVPPNVPVNDPAEDGTSINDTHSETTIALAGSTILSGYNDSFRASSNRYTGFSSSTDGGNSFTDLGSFTTTSNGDAGDPVLGYDTSTGRTYFASLAFNSSWLNIWRSDDALQTIMAPVNGAPGRSGLDKEWLAVDNYAGTGQGNVYLVVRDFSSGNGIYLFRSTDQGATFGPNGGVLIASGGGGNVQGAWVTVGPDHTVYASWYDDTTATASVKIRSSTDGGQTFGAASTITNLQTTGVNGDLNLGGFRSNAFTQVAVNPATGQLYAAYDDKGTGSDRADVFLRTSEDNGATWDPAIRVVDDTTGRDQWQPALAVTPSGNQVGVFWYDRRNDPANNLIDRYGAVGVVSGGSVIFGPNFRISEVSFPPAFGHDPAITPPYMGDYDQAVADNTGFYLNWGDNRSPSLGHTGNRNDVRFAKIVVSVSGPAVVSISPRGNTVAPVSTFRVTFDEQIDPTTTTLDQFVVTDPNGNPVNVQSVTPVNDSDIQFDVVIDTQTQGGAYTVTVGPFIADMNGNYMDQDGDGDNADGPEDAFNGSFSIVGPAVRSTTLNGRVLDSLGGGQIVFNTAIDPNTFTPDQLVITGPGGITATNITVTPDDGTNTVFDVTFDPLTTSGNYTVSIGPNITDAFGNAMSASFSGTFVLTTDLIINGGFEDSDNGWVDQNSVQSSGFAGINAHSGTHFLALGAVGADASTSQTMTDVAGQVYHLQFFYFRVPGTPSDLNIYWDGGTPIYTEVNSAAHDWVEHDIMVTGTGHDTLTIAGRNDPSWDGIDDVSLTRGTAPQPGGHFGPAGQAPLAIALTANRVTPAQPTLVSDGHLAPGVAPVAAPPASLIPPATTANSIDPTIAPVAVLHQPITGANAVLDPLASDRYIV